jgi:uncharacterized protein
MKFIFFHGAFGSPQGNWFPQLKVNLESLGQEVISVQFPVENWDEMTKIGPTFNPINQNLKNWLHTFEKKVLPQIKRGERLCFIGHSLGPVFMLHIVEKFNIQLDSALFVIPFLEELPSKDSWQFDIVNGTFYRTDFNWEKLKKLIPVSYVLYSDTDPYVPAKRPFEFAQKMGSSLIVVKGGGHLNDEVKLFNFPLVLELCKTRLNMTEYIKSAV